MCSAKGADVTCAFEEIDVNGNGIVEFDEFFAWYNKFSDQMAELKAVAEAERAEAEAQISRWAETHTSRAAEHERPLLSGGECSRLP